ncbi:hypothetical protein QQ045_028429 [Rhodiola kirilowii]
MVFNSMRQRWTTSLAACICDYHRYKSVRISMFCTNVPTSESTSYSGLCNVVCTMNGSLDDLESSLNQSKVLLTSSMVNQVIEACKTEAPVRRLLRFFRWSRNRLSCQLEDRDFNAAIRVFAKLKDFTAMDILITDLGKEGRTMETETFCLVAEALVKLGREDEALGIFKTLEKYKCPQDSASVAAIVSALCEKGHARRAEGVIWHHKDKIRGAEDCIYRSLLHGWGVQGNVNNARQVLKEMRSNGIVVNEFCYNTFLRCLCNTHMKTDPSRLVSSALNVVMEMMSKGIEPTSITYNIVLSSLGKIRRVKESLRILDSMRKAGCSPDWVSYYLVIRVLYLSGRFGKGNQILDIVFEEGLLPERRFYYDLIGVLCGVERVNFALDLFERMMKYSVGGYGPMYDVLIPKLCRSGDFNKGRELWDEAISMGIALQCSIDELYPSVTQVFKPSRQTKAEIPVIPTAIATEDRYTSQNKTRSKRKNKVSHKHKRFRCSRSIGGGHRIRRCRVRA